MVKKCFSPDLALSNGLDPTRFPESEDEIALAEKVLSQELEKMSLDEHEKILFGVHGIATNDFEDGEGSKERLDAKLREMEEEINAISKDREAFDEARSVNADYVDNPKFRLMFLRAESYNAKAAAEMIISHFVVKERLFGDGGILGRDVRMSDLDRRDLAFLELGFAQVFPTRDAAGRTIVAMSPEFKKWGTKKELMAPLSRANWYFNMALLRDEETQKKGVVLVFYNYCSYQEKMSFDDSVHHMKSAIPQRVDACHFCLNDEKLKHTATGIKLFIDPQSRMRLRTHFGTPEEIDFELQTFGIPTDVSPMKKDGKMSTTWHHEWMSINRENEEKLIPQLKNERKYQPVMKVTSLFDSGSKPEKAASAEEASAPHLIVDDEIISIPNKFDVLFGKSKKEREHTGNLRAMHICDMHWDKYEAANKFQKTEVAERIVSMIHQSGGRFLRAKAKGGWVEVDDKDAREKISHFFRFMRAKTKETRASETSGSPQSSEEFKAEAQNAPSAKRVTPSSSPEPRFAVQPPEELRA